MELVYLWVEDYKNIKKQGFNFSPRFRCEYDDEKTELTIEENKEYVSIFPDKINITAIVGENGSGKSGILKALNKILNYIPLTELGYVRSSKMSFPFKFILVVNMNDEVKYLSSFDLNSMNVEKVNVLGHYNYFLYLADEQKPQNDEYREDVFIAHRFSLNEVIMAKMITSQYISNVDFELTTFMYLPLQIEIKNINLYQMFSELISSYGEGYGFSLELEEGMTEREEKQAYKSARNQSFAMHDDLESIFSEADDDFHRFLIIRYIHEYGDDNYSLFSDKAFLSKELNELESSISEDEFNEYFKEEIKEIDSFTRREKAIYFDYFKNFFEFDFIDVKNRRYNDLSHGEQTIFAQFLNMYFFSLHEREDLFLFLLDEPDLSLHPQWQKNYIFELEKLLNELKMNYQVMITTHSPFILSDLPKENIVFLERGKQVLPHIETFGANIHTLLSHGFFMRDGLIGEFAKEKINEAIGYLNKKELSVDEIEYCENIISIIGEPILKRQLQKILDSKRLSEVEQIKEQIKQLQEELAKKEDKKND